MSRDRSLFAVTAGLAWAGILMRLGHDWWSHPVGVGLGHGLFGPYREGVLGSLQVTLDNLSYFTYWSNFIVAVVMTVLAVAPSFERAWFRTARNAAALMILLTGVLYVTLIAPTDVVRGTVNVVINYDVHYVVPVLATLVWLIAGPRGWFTWAESLRIYAVPLLYLAYTLSRGALAHVYPYDFFDVTRYGYGSVLVTMAVIMAASYGVVVLFVLTDRGLLRWHRGP